VPAGCMIAIHVTDWLRHALSMVNSRCIAITCIGEIWCGRWRRPAFHSLKHGLFPVECLLSVTLYGISPDAFSDCSLFVQLRFFRLQRLLEHLELNLISTMNPTPDGMKLDRAAFHPS